MAIAAHSYSGRDLAAERVRQNLRAADVAARMGVSRQRITNIEQLHRVRPQLAERYLNALADLDPAPIDASTLRELEQLARTTTGGAT